MPVKPHNKEEEFFYQQELEKKRKVALEEQMRQQEEERQRLKELHWMRCPKDGSQLIETEFRGVKVDVCATCNGMWLDAGELEEVSRAETGFVGGLVKFFKAKG